MLSEATKATKRRYYLAHRENILAQSRDYLFANREKINAKKKLRRQQQLEKARLKDKADYQKHREKRIASARTFYRIHRNEILAYQKKRRTAHPALHIARRYKLAQEQYEALLAFQAGRCALCSEPLEKSGRTSESAHVDHDHETGIVRGILHRRCNLMIGQAGDDPDILEAGAAYLKKFEVGPK